MIENLNEKQVAMLPKYTEMGIKIGLATKPDFDEELVKDLIDKHRVSCGLPETKNWIIYDSPITAIKEIEDINTANACYGQHDTSWLTYYLFFRVELGLVEETEPLRYLMEIQKHIGWWWVNEENTIITRQPSKIHLIQKKDLKVLHNENGLALEYKDGTGVYALNGITIPASEEWVITTKDLDPKKVLGIKNTEIRTEALKKIGMDKAMQYFNPKTLNTHTCKKGGDYKLVEIDINNNKRVYLDMTCPSKGSPHFEAVPPHIKTCEEALAWREEDIGDYIVPNNRT